MRTSFTSAQLTHFGGVYLLHQFLQRLNLRTVMSQSIVFDQRNNRYTLSELLIALLYPMILGLEKIEVTAFLGTNGIFQYITGLPSFPNPTTLRRFLTRAASLLWPQVQSLHDNLRTHFLCLPEKRTTFWLDCDSTVRTLYGHQQGAEIGYNPTHRGKRSYHPLIVTEAHGGDCLSGLLRPGNVHTADRIEELVKRALTLLPAHRELRLRADAGFYDGNFVALLREKGIRFAIVAHLTGPLKAQLLGRRYQRVSSLFSVAEFRYQPHGWKKPERFVVLRRRLPDEAEGAQTTLFTLDRYAYSVIVTDLDLTAYGVFQFYQDRAAMERIIRTLKEDYPFGSAPTNGFEANVLYAELSLLAYNLMTWFKRQTSVLAGGLAIVYPSHHPPSSAHDPGGIRENRERADTAFSKEQFVPRRLRPGAETDQTIGLACLTMTAIVRVWLSSSGK